MEDYENESVMHNEELFCIKGDKLKENLHRNVGCITFLDKNKKMFVGSGALIAHDIILTAAHNIYDKKNHCENSCFKFYEGADGVAENYYQIVAWRFPQQFKTCKDSNKLPFDYAIMRQKGKKRGIYTPFNNYYLALSVPCQICLPKDTEKQVGIFGFPERYQNMTCLDEKGTRMVLYQYGLTRKGRILELNSSKFKICYGISTFGGQSGCPVIVDNGIIAVHVGGQTNFNVGRIVDQTKSTVACIAAPSYLKTILALT